MHSITKFLAEGILSAMGGILLLKIMHSMYGNQGELNSLILLFFQNINGG